MKSYICTAPKTFYFLKQRLDSPSPLRSLSHSPEKKKFFYFWKIGLSLNVSSIFYSENGIFILLSFVAVCLYLRFYILM